MEMENGLMRHIPIIALIAQYDAIIAKTNIIFDNIDAVEKELIEAVDDNYYSMDFYLRQTDRQTQIRKIRKVFWRYACNKLQLYNLMSEKKRHEFDKQMENDELPEFTPENVHSTFQMLIDNVPSLIEDTIKEAFEIFRPHNSGHKTNTEFAVGKRVILTSMIDTFMFQGKRTSPSLNYHYDQRLRIMDNAFSLMDGKGPIKYPSDSITILKEAINNRQPECETTYFKYRWHMNGTLHISFKRMDLVQRMNEVGGKGLLNQEAA